MTCLRCRPRTRGSSRYSNRMASSGGLCNRPSLSRESRSRPGSPPLRRWRCSAACFADARMSTPFAGRARPRGSRAMGRPVPTSGAPAFARSRASSAAGNGAVRGGCAGSVCQAATVDMKRGSLRKVVIRVESDTWRLYVFVRGGVSLLGSRCPYDPII